MDNFFQNIKDGSVYKFFSGGVWQKSKDGQTIKINSPVDGSQVGEVQAVSQGEIDEMVSGAVKAQKLWANYPVEDRAAIIKKAADLLRENMDEILPIKIMEIGKTKKAGESSILRSADIISYTADQIEAANHPEVFYSKDFPGAGESKTALVSKEPWGVVLAISPFNYPINLAVTKIAPALLAGNSVIVKGPTQGSISTAMLVEVFNKAGVPAGVINFVSGRGSEIGDYLVIHKDINMIDFTGSSEVGKSIATKVGYKPLLLEMGGKDAALVFDDADLDLTAAEIVDGAFSYAGQRCTAIKRVLVDKIVHDQLLEKIIAKTKEKYNLVGDPSKDETQMGPVISEKQAEYIQELVFDAVENGAKIVIGGARKLNYFDATVLDSVNTDMRIAWEEQFGPVLPIISCDNVEQMIEIHNRSQYGLGGSIFTTNIEKAKEIAKQLQTGVIQINKKSERYPDNFPFLGVKDSGLGTQGVRWSIIAMMRIKSIVDNK
ncbi:MAG: aldehyde dehydrogenase family protein [Patescibacteria group bacterium]|nr:aldehyde dehydrogenase family protein [Patescibacteria group bacterium]